MDNNIGYRRTVKYLGLFGGVNGVSTLLNLLRNKLASIILGVSGLGLIAIYNRTVQMFSDCTNLSLSFSAVRHLSEVYENGSESEVEHAVKVVRSLALLAGLVGMSLFAAFSSLMSQVISGDVACDKLSLLLLSPVLVFISVSGGELAILRGARKLNSVAAYTLWTAFVALVIAIPAYYFFGTAGILPSIFIIALFQTVGILSRSLKIYSYRVKPFSLALLREGIGVVKMGAGYMYATILTSCTIWLIYEGLADSGGDVAVGYFSAGFVIVNMLPTIMFSALDSDYYPRLSGAFSNVKLRNELVNEQLEVHLLVQPPVIFATILLLPELLPFLYLEEVSMAVRMTQIALFGLLFNVLAYPISFMPLSKGDISFYLLQETASNVMNLLLVVLGYRFYGLVGVGCALLLSRLSDMVVASAISFIRYGFRVSWRGVRSFVINILFAVAMSVVLLKTDGLLYWSLGGVIVVCSSLFSLWGLTKSGGAYLSVFNKFFSRK